MKTLIEKQRDIQIPTIGWWPNDDIVEACTPIHQDRPDGPLYGWAFNSFSQNELQSFVEDSVVDLIVHHGNDFTPTDFVRRYGHRELVRPHASAGALGAIIDREGLQKIFTGEIDNWQDLGGKNIPISLYAHGAKLNFRAFQWQLEENGFSINVPVKRMPDYQELANAGKRDAGALIFGLRSEAQFSEWLLRAPLCEGVFQPQTISVFMRSSSNIAPIVTEIFLKSVYKRLKEDRLVSIEFPLWNTKHH